jgi:transcriptional regulator with XRE-family HTH domain
MLNAGGWPGNRGPDGMPAAEDVFHQEVRRHRRARGLTRDELAARTGYSRRYIGQLEQPSKGVPARRVVAAVDAVLRAGGRLLALRDQAAADQAAARAPDPELASRRRVAELLRSRPCDAELDHLDQALGQLIATVETLGPRDTRDQVLEAQRLVDDLLRLPMLPHQQFRLFLIAGQLAGLLAIASLDLDELPAANACGLEAAVFTELTGHEGLRTLTSAVNRLVGEAGRHAERLATQVVTVDRQAPSGGHVSADATAPADAPAADPPGGASELAAQVAIGGGAAAGGDGCADDGRLPGAARLTSGGPGTNPADEPAAGRLAPERPEVDADAAEPSRHEDANLPPDPDEQSGTPRLVALAKGRMARYTVTGVRPERPLSGISRAFQPPV